VPVSHPLAADDGHPKVEFDPQGNSPPDQSGPRSILIEQVIVAPKQLGLQTRRQFRSEASSLVDLVMAGTGRLIIDCSQVESVDSSGLNALILIQRKAADRRVRVHLKGLTEELLGLLVLTKLDDLFEVRLGQAR